MRGLLRLAALTVAISVLGPAATASQVEAQGAPAVKVTEIQPIEGSTVVVERVAAGKDYVSDQWRLVMDIWLRNDGVDTLRLSSVVVRFDDESIPPFIGLGQDLGIEPGKEGKVMVPDDRLHQFPLPADVAVELLFEDYDVPFLVTAPLEVYANQPAAMGSYRFPGTRADLDALGDDCYWSTAEDQGTFEGHHRASKVQRFAYDLGARCWSEEKQAWSQFRPGADGSENEDWLVFGLPLYAMADGVVYECTMHEPENTVGIQGPNGNGLAIQTGVDEYVIYAHMQQFSIPFNVCQAGATVTAGQYLGNVGNSGTSSNPHLHTVSQRGVTGVEPHDGRPQLFHNIRILEVGSDWNWFAPPVDLLPWHTTNGAAPGAFMLIDPLPFDDSAPWGPAGEQVAIEPRDPAGIVEQEAPPTETPVPNPTATAPIVIVAIPVEPTPTVPSSSVPIDPWEACRIEPTSTPEARDGSTGDGEPPAQIVVIAAIPAETADSRLAPGDGC